MDWFLIELCSRKNRFHITKEAILLADQIKEDKIKLTGLVNLQSSFGMCYDENEEIKYLDSVKSYCFQTLKLAKEMQRQ